MRAEFNHHQQMYGIVPPRHGEKSSVLCRLSITYCLIDSGIWQMYSIRAHYEEVQNKNESILAGCG